MIQIRNGKFGKLPGWIAAVRIVGALAIALVMVSELRAREDYEGPPIHYSATQPSDVIQQLEKRIASGEFKLEGGEKEILRLLLAELRIPIESQILVFSKTSLQRGRIHPGRPRALYFSDTCYIGWVPGGLIEVTSIDPLLGPVFYSLDWSPKAALERPRFQRDNDCLRCHGGSLVRNIPGVLARSVFPDSNGEPLLRHGTEVVDYRTPFEQRWGGWYVTGKHGEALHRGNMFATEKNGQLIVDFSSGANLTDLSPFFSTRDYLGKGSDIVALLVFEHQVAMHNAITRAGFNCRRMLAYQIGLQRDLKEPITETELVYESVKRVFENAAQDLVDHLLFLGEALLPAGIEGSAQFPPAFAAGVPQTRCGMSLKELDLTGQIFRTRCSYLIYSDAFLALPELLKTRVYARLREALHPESENARYSYLETDEKARIAAILKETHPDFSGDFAGIDPSASIRE